MDKNTGTLGATRPHIDTLQVRPGYAFLVEASATIVLGGGRRQRDAELADAIDAYPWHPAGRGA